jgi:hypothetical protein
MRTPRQPATTAVELPEELPARQVLAVMAERHCKRAFLDRGVSREIVDAVLRAAAHAPSSRQGDRA